MKRKNKRNLIITSLFFMLFFIWTYAISIIDVRKVGPNNSSVGFATFNSTFHNLTGVHMNIYNLTDWLGLIPVTVMFGFAILGLVELIKRKSLLKVDLDILILGGYYILVFISYILFEIFPVNFRPVLIDGFLEASYPSSTTLLVLSVMPTAIIQTNLRTANKRVRISLNSLTTAFIAFMVLGRTVCGVHWFTDIIGGILLSVTLIMMYYSLVILAKQKTNPPLHHNK